MCHFSVLILSPLQIPSFIHRCCYIHRHRPPSLLSHFSAIPIFISYIIISFYYVYLPTSSSLLHSYVLGRRLLDSSSLPSQPQLRRRPLRRNATLEILAILMFHAERRRDTLANLAVVARQNVNGGKAKSFKEDSVITAKHCTEFRSGSVANSCQMPSIHQI